MNIKLKGVFTISMLTELMQIVGQFDNGIVYQALFTLAFFGIFRLSSLVPAYVNSFVPSRFPLVLDLIWAPPGVQVLLKHAKNMQGSDEFKIVCIQKLKNQSVYPVKALQKMIRTLHHNPTEPLFMLNVKGTNGILTTFKFAMSWLSM